MYVRIVTFTGASDIDGGIRFVRERLLPFIGDQKGFRGLSVSAGRRRGIFAVLSTWDTEEERDASWEALAPSRTEGHAVIGGELSTASYEQLLAEEGDTHPVLGSALMVTPVSTDPAMVDEHFGVFRTRILPLIRSGRGFQAARVLVDRGTGNGLVETVWATEDTMRAAAAQAEARRHEAIERGVRFGEVSYREIIFSDR